MQRKNSKEKGKGILKDEPFPFLFSLTLRSGFSELLEEAGTVGRQRRLFTIHNLNFAELLIRYPHYAYFPYVWQKAAHSGHVDVGMLTAAAMAYVDRVLEHYESIAQQVLAEQGRLLAACTVASRDVE